MPCLEPPTGTAALTEPVICGVLVLYTRCELPQSESFNMLLHALGSAAAAAYALGISTPPVAPNAVHRPPSSYISVLNDKRGTTGMSWLLLAAARSLQVDIAEHWTAHQVTAQHGGGVCMAADSLLLSEYVQSLPETIVATGTAAEPHHPFSSQLSRASLYAGKLVWCNGANSSGLLDGIRLPVQTAVGLPLRNHSGGGASFVLYSLRRLEQSTTVTYFLAQIQVLAAASHAAIVTPPSAVTIAPAVPIPGGQFGNTQKLFATPQPVAAAPARVMGGTTSATPALKAEFSAGGALGALVHSTASTAAPTHALHGQHHVDLPSETDTVAGDCTRVPAAKRVKGASPAPNGAAAAWPPELWGGGHGQQQGAVMSTEQVLNLIDCLGGERLASAAPACAEPAATEVSLDAGAPMATLSRKSSALALALEPFGSIEDSFADFPDSLATSTAHNATEQVPQMPDAEVPRAVAESPVPEPPLGCTAPSLFQHSKSTGAGCCTEMDSLSVSSPHYSSSLLR